MTAKGLNGLLVARLEEPAHRERLFVGAVTETRDAHVRLPCVDGRQGDDRPRLLPGFFERECGRYLLNAQSRSSAAARRRESRSRSSRRHRACRRRGSGSESCRRRASRPRRAPGRALCSPRTSSSTFQTSSIGAGTTPSLTNEISSAAFAVPQTATSSKNQARIPNPPTHRSYDSPTIRTLRPVPKMGRRPAVTGRAETGTRVSLSA